MSSSKKSNTHHNLFGMLGISLVVIVLLVFFTWDGQKMQRKINIYEEKIESLNQSIEEEALRAEEIIELQEYMETDEYVEQVAREKLGLVKENEIVFKEKE